MKKFLFIILIFANMAIMSAQQKRDTLYFRDGRIEGVDISSSYKDRIEFVYPDELTINYLDKSEITRIIYRSGREEICGAKIAKLTHRSIKSDLPPYKGTHSFEIGAGLNAYGILGAVGGPGRYVGPGAYFEYRYAFAEHFDIGAQLNYKYGKGHSADFGDDMQSYGFTCNQIAFKASADYDICPSRLASPYIGVGLGVGGIFEKTTDGRKSKEPYGTFCPRIGVRVWKFTLSLEVDLAYNGRYGFLTTPTSTALSLGFRF